MSDHIKGHCYYEEIGYSYYGKLNVQKWDVKGMLHVHVLK